MTHALAIVLAASGSQASDASMRDEIMARARSDARASVTILQPEIIDFHAVKERGERAKVRRDAAGTLWIEFS